MQEALRPKAGYGEWPIRVLHQTMPGLVQNLNGPSYMFCSGSYLPILSTQQKTKCKLFFLELSVVTHIKQMMKFSLILLVQCIA